MMHRWARWVAALALVFTGLPARPGEPTRLSLVPWKVIEPGDDTHAPLILFWIPASRDDLRRSDLLTSEELTLYSSHCVAMRVVRFDDRALLARLDASAITPAAVLTDGDGEVIDRVESRDGALASEQVEAMVRDELDRRADRADELLDDARAKADAGDATAAIALYREVWEQRCVCPRQAHDAQRALKKLKAR